MIGFVLTAGRSLHSKLDNSSGWKTKGLSPLAVKLPFREHAVTRILNSTPYGGAVQ